MQDVLSVLKGSIDIITLNRGFKSNALDANLVQDLQLKLDKSINNPDVRVIILNAQGKNFCAGADLSWMQHMGQASYSENIDDAMGLASLMKTLYECPKPTIALVQGAAFGGGAGLVAICDIAIATPNAKFCFPEVKLGLIPAIISPYVVKALGEKVAKYLFISADTFDVVEAQRLNLVQYCISETELLPFALKYAEKIATFPPLAVIAAKDLIKKIENRPFDEPLMQEMANLIAEKRISFEAQDALKEFINKKSQRSQ